MSVVVITGCSSGFGLEGALAFARNGDQVYATMRDPDRAGDLLEAATRENLDVEVRKLDVMQPESFAGFVESVVGEAGAIDVLVNNAGILRAGAFEDLTEQSFRDVLETNYVGPMLLARAVLPQMRSSLTDCKGLRRVSITRQAHSRLDCGVKDISDSLAGETNRI